MVGIRARGPWHCLPLVLLFLLTTPLAGPVRAQSREATGAQAGNRIWGRIHTRDGEQHEGFLLFVSARHAASWTDSFRAEQSVPNEPLRTWVNAARSGALSVRTVELKGYRITWNAGSDDFSRRTGNFAGSRWIRIPYGSLEELRGQPGQSSRQRTLFLTVQLRGPEADEDGTPRGPEHVWSGGRQSLILGYTEDWRGTTIEVDGPGDGLATVAFRDVARVEFAAAPSGLAPRSARLFGTATDRSGRSFTGFLKLDGDKVLDSDTLEGWLDGPSPRVIPLALVCSFERVGLETRRGPSEGVRVTLAAGEVVELIRGSEPGGNPVTEVVVADPGLGTVTMEWGDFSALHLHGNANGPAGCQRDGDGLAPVDLDYHAFDGGTPLRGTVVTATGEEFEGRIRWGTLKEWSWDLLNGSLDGTELAVRFTNIRSIERLAAPELPRDQAAAGAKPPGRLRVHLLDGRTFAISGHGNPGSDDTGILVHVTAPEGEPDQPETEPDSLQAPASDASEADGAGEARTGWQLIRWEEVRVVRFEHPGRKVPGS